MAITAESSRHGEYTQVIRCPKCGKAMWISPKVNGQNVKCPFCFHEI